MNFNLTINYICPDKIILKFSISSNFCIKGIPENLDAEFFRLKSAFIYLQDLLMQ